VKELELNFNDSDLDTFLLRWMSQGLTEAELREWKTILLYNRQFREDFCDFVKSFRDPAWNQRPGRTL
jgi:hypothetical protein